MENVIHERARSDHEESAYDSDDRSRPEFDVRAGRGYRHKPRERSVKAHGYVRFFAYDPRKYHTYDGCYRRRYRSVNADERKLFRTRRRSAVESVPAEPKDEYAERTDRKAVTEDRIDFGHLAVLVARVFADTGSEDRRADERAQSADHMYYGATCEVDEAEVKQPSVAAPYPARFDGVYDQAYDRAVYAVSGETCSFRHSAGHDRRRRSTEYEVEEESRITFRFHSEYRRGNAYKVSYLRFDTHQRITDEHEHYRTDAEVHHIFHDDVSRIFSSGKSRFDHCEAALHKPYQYGSNQKPYTCGSKKLTIHNKPPFTYPVRTAGDFTQTVR